MNEAASTFSEEQLTAPDAPRRGRPPRQVPDPVAVAPEELVHVVIAVKPSEGWRCPFVPDGAGGTRVTEPRERLWVPASLAAHMVANELAIILKGDE